MTCTPPTLLRPRHAPAPAPGGQCLRLSGLLRAAAAARSGEPEMRAFSRSTAATCSVSASATTAPRDGSRCCRGFRHCCASDGLPRRRRDRAAVLPARARLSSSIRSASGSATTATARLIAVLAEVNNTFGGRHNYLLHNADGAACAMAQDMRASKVFHVSPFCEVEGGYRFRFHLAAQHGAAWRASTTTTPRATAADRDRRQAHARWTTRALLGAFLRMPLLTAGVIFRIHWQALHSGSRACRFSCAPSPVTQPLRGISK